MQSDIIEKLKDMGKITDEDVREALRMIPSQFEIDLIKDIMLAYCDEVVSEEDEKLWISHFLPILRNESFKVMEKMRDLNNLIPIIEEVSNQDNLLSQFDEGKLKALYDSIE